ncbi:hypothetical protein J6590_056748 [Homalodisca vitripennis]|nr:hypothetical protein J6590_056748 [Homalodisca vitripennis]
MSSRKLVVNSLLLSCVFGYIDTLNIYFWPLLHTSGKHLPPVTSVGSMSPPTQVYGCMRRRRPLNVSPRRGALRQFVLSRTGLDVYLSVSVSASGLSP